MYINYKVRQMDKVPTGIHLDAVLDQLEVKQCNLLCEATDSMSVQFKVFFEILLKSFKKDNVNQQSMRNAFSLHCPRITFYSTYTFSSPLRRCLPSLVVFIFGLLLCLVL